MSNKYINSAILAGAIIIGGFAIFTSTSNGQTVKITDDGIRPVDVQKVVITKTETKETITTVFDGTLSDLVNEQLPRAIKIRDDAIAEVARIQALITATQTELDKLPARSVAESVEVIPE